MREQGGGGGEVGVPSPLKNIYFMKRSLTRESHNLYSKGWTEVDGVFFFIQATIPLMSQCF